MSSFSAVEVLKMAEKAESNAAVFYRRAAGFQKSLPARDALLKLAAMEEEHRMSFGALIATAGGSTSFQDPYGDLQLYLNAVVDMQGGEGSLKAGRLLSGKESLPQVISMAMGAESQSILFYEGILDMLSDDPARQIVTRIIREEKTHVAALQALLK